MRVKLNSQRGFSLIEILIGVLLLGITGVAAISLLGSANQGSATAVKVAEQNGQLRQTVDLLKSRLSQASRVRPLLTTPQGAVAQTDPETTGVIYLRAEQVDPGNSAADPDQVATKYFAEYLWYDAPSKELRLKQMTSASSYESAWPTMDASSFASTKYRVLARNVSDPATTGQPMFKWYRTATASLTVPALTDPNPTDWERKAGLVDVKLIADADDTRENVQASTLETSVFLERVGGHTQGAGGDSECLVEQP